MANVKITDLTAYTDAASTDVLPIVDVSANVTKKISISDILKATPAGTAALPAIAIDGDPNTGIWSPGADTLAISTGGSERVRIDSSGRLLVGTSTSALERLVVLGDGGGIQINRNQTGSPTSGQALGSIGFKGVVSTNSNAAAEVLIQAAADEAHSSSTAGSRLEFHTKPSGTGPGSSPTERLRIDSSGRLLVGTSSDSGGALLQVNGDRIRVGTAKTPASASATGTAGEICWDANYIYVCTATNTWKRAAIATW